MLAPPPEQMAQHGLRSPSQSSADADPTDAGSEPHAAGGFPCPGCGTMLPPGHHSQDCGACSRRAFWGPPPGEPASPLPSPPPASPLPSPLPSPPSPPPAVLPPLAHVPDPDEGEFEGACNLCGGSHCYCVHCGRSYCIICEEDGCEA